jgi:hypothetical protein
MQQTLRTDIDQKKITSKPPSLWPPDTRTIAIIDWWLVVHDNVIPCGSLQFDIRSQIFIVRNRVDGHSQIGKVTPQLLKFLSILTHKAFMGENSNIFVVSQDALICPI